MDKYIVRINEIARRNEVNLPDIEDRHFVMNPNRLFIDQIKQITSVEAINLRIIFVGLLIRDKLDSTDLDEQKINEYLALVFELTNAKVQLCNAEDAQVERQIARLAGTKINIDDLFTKSLPKSISTLGKPMNLNDVEGLIGQIKDKILEFSVKEKIPHEIQEELWSRITELRNLEVRRCNLEDKYPLKNLRCLLGIEDTQHATRKKIPIPNRPRKTVSSVTNDLNKKRLPPA